LIIPLVVSPWLTGIVWVLLRVGTRLSDPPPSYFASAERRLSVR
jgi:hypothetical protein